MASAMEPALTPVSHATPIVPRTGTSSCVQWQFRGTYHTRDRPTVTRASSTDVTSPGPASAAWVGVPTIWQTRSQHHHQRSVDDVDPRASPPRGDSVSRSRTHRMRTHAGSGDTTAVGAGLPPRIPPAAAPPAPGAVGQNLSLPASPTHSGSPPRSKSPTDVAMSRLGTATLLNGSAPDVELEHPHSYASRSFPPTALHTINVGGVHDFVPATQRRPEHARHAPARLGHGPPASSITVDASFTLPSRGNGPSGRVPSTTFLHGYHDPGDHSVPLTRPDPRWEDPSTLSSPPFGGAGVVTTGGPDLNGLATDMRSFHWGESSHPDRRAVLPVMPSGPWSHPRVPMTPVRSEHAAGSRSGPTPYATPILSHQPMNLSANVFHPGQHAAHASASGVYTPSYTPPTAPGSRRSNSGGGTSSHASGYSAESRFGPCDPGLTVLGSHHGTSPPQLGSELHGQSRGAHGHPYPGPPTAVVPRYHDAGHHHHHHHHHHHAAHDPSAPPDKDQNLSPLLRDFRANHKTKRFELKDAYRHIVEFSGDQHGSRFIQAKLETASGDEKERVFDEIQENALQLMTDIFGNYVIQKLFEYGTQAQKRILANQMKGRIHYLTTQVYGCRVVQKALEHVLTDQQASIVKELEGNVLSIVENQNGNHVIQKAIERVPSEHIQFMFDAHHGHIVRLSKHNYGCRVVQRMLEYAPPTVTPWTLAELRGAVPTLIEDQFGNYVIQHILRHGEAADRRLIVTIIQQQLLHFSKHKFASNVVEAALESAEDGQRQDILRALTTGADSQGHSQIYGLIRDQYGNYVIQKVLTRLDGAALNALVLEIQHHLVPLRKVSHGKQVSAMEKALAGAIAALGRQYTGPSSPGAPPASTEPTPRIPYPGHFHPPRAQQPRSLRPPHLTHL